MIQITCIMSELNNSHGSQMELQEIFIIYDHNHFNSISITGTKAVHNNPLTLFRHLVLQLFKENISFSIYKKKIKRHRRHKNHTPLACLLHLVASLVSSHMHTFEHRVHMQKINNFTHACSVHVAVCLRM